MSKNLWSVQRNAVVRAGVVIATLTHSDGRLGWRGLGIERVGFTDEADVLADVKYFYRHPPVTRLTFRSGRMVTL